MKEAENKGLRQELLVAYRQAGTVVVKGSRRKAPELSGLLKRSIRNQWSGGRATVLAGKPSNESVEYAGVIHYGWAAHNITPQPFIHDALRDDWTQVYETFTEAVDRVTAKINS